MAKVKKERLDWIRCRLKDDRRDIDDLLMARELLDELDEMERERDEARAEVARLEDAHQRETRIKCEQIRRTVDAERERDEARAALTCQCCEAPISPGERFSLDCEACHAQDVEDTRQSMDNWRQFGVEYAKMMRERDEAREQLECWNCDAVGDWVCTCDSCAENMEADANAVGSLTRRAENAERERDAFGAYLGEYDTVCDLLGIPDDYDTHAQRARRLREEVEHDREQIERLKRERDEARDEANKWRHPVGRLGWPFPWEEE